MIVDSVGRVAVAPFFPAQKNRAEKQRREYQAFRPKYEPMIGVYAGNAAVQTLEQGGPFGIGELKIEGSLPLEASAAM